MMRRLAGALRRSLERSLARVRATIRSFAGVAPEDVHPARVYWDDGVPLALMDLVQESVTRASGRVQVITLAEFRSSIGDLWDRYETRILIIAESTISRMIGRGNTYIPQSKDTWLLLFPALEEPEALNRADAIAARIGEKLVGAHFSESPPPLLEASKLDLTGALNADGTLNLERVKAAVENVRQASSRGLTPAKLPPARAGAKSPKLIVAKSTPQPLEKSEARQFAISFRPAWNNETQSVSSFFFRAARPDGTEVFAPNGACPNDATVLELLGLAARAFSEMCEQGLRAVFTIPVPFPALQGPHLGEIQRLIANLPQRERLVHLRIEVTHIPQRTGADILVPIRERFRPYMREVAFLLDVFQLSDQILALDHITVGVEIPSSPRRGDDEVFQAMLLFRQRAARRPTYILGLSSRLQVAHAVTAGIGEVGGSGVAADMKKLPDQVTVIRRQDLLL